MKMVEMLIYIYVVGNRQEGWKGHEMVEKEVECGEADTAQWGGQRTWGSWDLCVVAQQNGQWPLQACCERMLLQWDGSSLLLDPWFSPCRMLFWGPCGKQQRNSKWLLFSYSQKEPVFVESCYSGSHDFLFIVNFIVPFFSVASRCLAGTRHAALGAKSLQLSPSFMDTWEYAKIRKLCSLSQHIIRVRRMPNCPESSPVLFLLTKPLDGLCLRTGYRH